MAETLHFELVSPEKLLRSGEVYMVVVPGTEGDFGVLPGHAPLVSTIRPGAIQVFPTSMNDVPERIFIDGGFAEVGPDGLTILAESAIPVGELDVEGAARDLAAAREALRSASGEPEIAAAEVRIAKLEAMQAVAVN
ncbi:MULTISPECIES: F0F1 ATP synthase subunit epsilon [Sphingosinicellaceae]|uniref:F0F1 ATP synthase subunit epsilon n=1 Tax=Sphingosinicellaceae TaxID=2820280 RepID=UPI001C1DD6B9|nr:MULTISPECIES: F0F1 ATP synthase subunit epsilon [Polymorphobacter]QYE35901.1 F0F1 ATP synthase subunit epsilon [Polymorphobacter sp. PAMC 29334]UAJ10732.1 F0F1 ATP synthase subunit epsilon [Polymorphobacter megasporae]